MMSFTLQRLLAAFVLVLASVSPALGQDVRVETQQQARAREQSLQAEAETPEDVSDPELGDINLVSRQPRPKMFTFFTGQSINYTSNAFLLRDGEQGDFFWNGRVGASFVPYATRDFTPRLTFDQNWFRYGEFGVLDFDSQNLTLDVKYDLNPADTWFVNGSYVLSRLSAPRGSTGEFYRSGFLNGSITHVMQCQTVPVTFGMTGGAYWRHGDPSSSDRVAAYLSMVATYSISETLFLQGFTRPEIQHYTHDLSGGSREDFNVTVGAALTWAPRDYLSVGATAAYVGNFSSESARRYDMVTPNLFLNAQIAF